jgi:hypothetical protein
MTPTLCALALVLFMPADPPDKSDSPRKPNPFAPSLRLLSEEEEKDLDRVIDRFILADVGRLRGAEAKQALTDFQKLGPDAIPALIRGVNRAAAIEHSCPAVTIAKKLSALLRASNDTELLQFARENIGAGVTRSRHMGVLKDLRVTCMLRARVVAQKTPSLKTAPTPDDIRDDLSSLTVSQLLTEAFSLQRGPRRESLLKELDKRALDDILPDLGAVAADDGNANQQKVARDLLDRTLSRLTTKDLTAKFADEVPEVRASAARVAAQKNWHVEQDLIDLLADDNVEVRQAAHQALVRLNPRVDCGPKDDADEVARVLAIKKWREWLTRKGVR